ncbi:LacI family transcriptional regulator [Pseudorhizobium endolithicum]|uniref:LacI family transcriptional regulator n=1 Tax=Pseudorhizobium endolithicum TaxID=1191678 RepID=A0ABN7K335_9HYPH|nr:LacI family DNA-binding transcriptional regulator [Pseudorhizobium endolithicum]CAD7053690.1 LacI family transcriptional regulator [Pseudorhizobium endolithicum]
MSRQGQKQNKITLLDVAKHANVSRATASLVVRKSPLVGAETRLRVEAAMHELGYVYNMGAARLRADRSHTIGVVVPNLTNPFFAELLGGMEASVDAAGLVMIIANSGDGPPRQATVLQRLREHGVDGIILCPAAGTTEELASQVERWKLPLVQALRHVTDELDYAGADYVAGIEEAVEYLVSLGHRTICFAVHGPIHSAYQERVQGFRDSMRRFGLQPELVIRVPDHLDQIAQQADALFAQGSAPTAVICFNDLVAHGLAAGFYDRGLKIGRDISLIGFDDVADAEAMRPRLTSVSTAPSEIGQKAAALLLDRIAQPTLAPRRWIIPTKLHIRNSCGPLSSS